MVICSKCGVDNKENAKFCVNCGNNLLEIKHKKRHPKDECFGLPHGGAIFGLVIGAVIVIWGFTELLGLNVELGTYVIIIIGIIIVSGAIYNLKKNR